MCTIHMYICYTNCLLPPGDAISFFTIHLYIQFIYIFYYTLHECVQFIYTYISIIPTAFSNQEMLLASSPLPKYTAPTWLYMNFSVARGHTRKHTRTHTYTNIHIHIHVKLQLHARTLLQTRARTHTRTRTCTHTQINTHHTHQPPSTTCKLKSV